MTDSKQSAAMVVDGFVDWEPSAQESFERENEAANAGEILKLRDNAVTMVRILPGLKFGDYQMPHPSVTIWQHFYDFPGDATGTKKVKFNCPLRMAQRPCPGCEAIDAWIRQHGKPAFQSAASNMLYAREAKRSVIYNAIDCDVPEAGVRKFYANPRKGMSKGPGIFELLEEMRTGDRIEFWKVLGAAGGTNIAFKKEKGGKQYEVTYKIVRGDCVRCDLESIGDGMHTLKQWAAMAHDLRNEARVPTYEECVAQIRGDGPARDDDADRAPRARRGARAQDDLEDLHD